MTFDRAETAGEVGSGMPTGPLAVALIGIVVAGAVDALASPNAGAPITAGRLFWPAGQTDATWRKVLLGLAPAIALSVGVIAGSQVSASWAVGLGLVALALEQFGAVMGRLGGIFAMELDQRGR